MDFDLAPWPLHISGSASDFKARLIDVSTRVWKTFLSACFLGLLENQQSEVLHDLIHD